jgi:hypothetical protein
MSFFAAEAEFFCRPQIDDEKFASSSVIARNNSVARLRCRVKRSESGDDSRFGKILLNHQFTKAKMN